MDVLYLSEGVSDYVTKSLEVVLAIHANEPAGDVLVFLTGREECDRLVSLIEDSAGASKGAEGLGLFAVAIYASMLPEDQVFNRALGSLLFCFFRLAHSSFPQLAVFSASAKRMRKVVVATNIAETSVTVPGVRYVVDCGFVKIKWFNPTSGMESLTVVPVSQASANQRAGRAGRVMPGKCFRLYPEAEFERLDVKASPEMQRADLSTIVLQLKGGARPLIFVCVFCFLVLNSLVQCCTFAMWCTLTT